MRNFAEMDAASAHINVLATDDYIYDQKLRVLLLACVAFEIILVF